MLSTHFASSSPRQPTLGHHSFTAAVQFPLHQINIVCALVCNQQQKGRRRSLGQKSQRLAMAKPLCVSFLQQWPRKMFPFLLLFIAVVVCWGEERRHSGPWRRIFLTLIARIRLPAPSSNLQTSPCHKPAITQAQTALEKSFRLMRCYLALW